MRTDLLNDPMFRQMYENALIDLSNGIVNPIDKEILSDIPLPPDFVDPYAAQDMEAVTVMNLAYNSLTTLIEEAKKANYFSQHFVTLSKLVMNGVASVAKGLATLHAMGEPLDQAPMKIEDLIGVGSYHIRKSYLGVLQTAKSHPEISERLLLNQLSWTNTLMRLFKTKDKLQQAPKIKAEHPALPAQTVETPMLGEQSAEALPKGDSQALPEAAPFHEPGRYAPHRAFSPIYKTGTVTVGSDLSQRGLSRKETDPETGTVTDRSALSQRGLSPKETDPETETVTVGSALSQRGLSPKETDPETGTVTGGSALSQRGLSPKETETVPEDELNELPSYQAILERVRKRSEKTPNGAIEFTFDEIGLLLSDPQFIGDYPKLADRLTHLIPPTDDG